MEQETALIKGLPLRAIASARSTALDEISTPNTQLSRGRENSRHPEPKPISTIVSPCSLTPDRRRRRMHVFRLICVS